MAPVTAIRAQRRSAIAAVALGLSLLLVSFSGAYADPDPLDDFASTSFVASDFKEANLTGGGLTFPNGKISPTSVANFPGSATLGLSTTVFQIKEGGLVTPHWHPRATEMSFVVAGQLEVGFVSSNFTFFQNTINPGDVTVFPRGLLHYILCKKGQGDCTMISGLDAQDPGADFVNKALAALPSYIVKATFQLNNDKVVGKIQNKKNAPIESIYS